MQTFICKYQTNRYRNIIYTICKWQCKTTCYEICICIKTYAKMWKRICEIIFELSMQKYLHNIYNNMHCFVLWGSIDILKAPSPLRGPNSSPHHEGADLSLLLGGREGWGGLAKAAGRSETAQQG
jgi:hypothetical protein